MTTDKPELHLWFDCETTGAPTDLVIEVGLVVTDSELNEINKMTGTIALPVGFDIDLHVVDVVKEMHTANGLWDDLVTPTWFNYHQADDAMFMFLQQTMDTYDENYLRNVGEPIPLNFNYKYRLAGSGVSHYDSRFIKQHFPLVWHGLDGFDTDTKPTLDIGILRRFLQQIVKTNEWNPPTPVGLTPHRALDDAISHVEQARWYRDKIREINANAMWAHTDGIDP